MTSASPFAPVPQGVLFNADAGASAGGAGTSGGQGAGSAAGAGSSAASGGTGAGTGTAPVSLSDETPFSYGGKTYGSFKEFQSNYVPRSEYEGASKVTQQAIRQALAEIARAGQGAGNVRQNQPPVDPFAGIEGLPFVDGKTLSATSKAVLGPVVQAIQAIQKENQALKQTVMQLRGGVAPIAQRHSNDEFQQRLSKGITTLGVDAKDPFVSELAQDVFHSYEWKKGEEDSEFAKYLGDRYKAAEAHFKAKFRKELDDAKTRKWQRPGGNATPGAPAKHPFARASTADIARNVFAGQSANT